MDNEELVEAYNNMKNAGKDYKKEKIKDTLKKIFCCCCCCHYEKD